MFKKISYKYTACVNGEYGLSNCILKNGYSIDCTTSTKKKYDVIFHKWHWNHNNVVNFKIIKQYVDDFNTT